MSHVSDHKDGSSGTESATVAHFSPASDAYSPLKQRSTILVHQKSPLLVATPPQVTRALAYSHPFILPINKLVGLISWSTSDPWESFLLLASFWGIVLYGDVVLRWAAPLLLVVLLMLGMYSRRYSPLSSTQWLSVEGTMRHERKESDGKVRHHKSLDEILETLKSFTLRCNILLDPLLRLTDFLSTQTTATSASTRPALTAMFLRILFLLPIWYALTLPPLYLITTKRVMLLVGSLILSWHSRPAMVSRTILWRSRFVRKTCSAITGLDLNSSSGGLRKQSTHAAAAALATKAAAKNPSSKPQGIRFTFTLYENQRRWIGIGWTNNLLAYERSSWTDEQLNAAVPKEDFELPEVDGGIAKWRWVDGSKWTVEGPDGEATDPITPSKGRKSDAAAWIYYDNKWRGPSRTDSWGKYTRRRKWCRDAELVEVSDSESSTRAPTPTPDTPGNTLGVSPPTSGASPIKKGWFGRSRKDSRSSTGTKPDSASFSFSVDREDEDDGYVPLQHRGRQNAVEADWGVADDVGFSLG